MKCGVSKVRYLAKGTPNCALASTAMSRATHAKSAARARANRTSMLVSDDVVGVLAVAMRRIHADGSKRLLSTGKGTALDRRANVPCSAISWAA